MKSWDPGWRPWIYAIAWLGGGAMLTGMAIWLVILVRYGWPIETAEQRLGILGIALYLVLSGPLLVMLGLGLRNAIRNLKASYGGASVEANSLEAPAAVVTTTTTVQTPGE